MSYLGKGHKNKIDQKNSCEFFFLLKEFDLEYEVLTFPHSIYSIIFFHNLNLLFVKLKKQRCPALTV